MSLKKVEQEYKNQPFKKADIIIYVSIILLIVLIFALIYAIKPKSALDLIEIYQDDKLIATYSFSQDSLNIKNHDNVDCVNKENGYELIVKIGEKENSIFIDVANKAVDMVHTNCSSSKDCTLMHIKKVGDTIICVPNGIVIKAIGEGEIKDPEIG